MRAAATLLACLTLVACGSEGDDDGRQAASGPEGASLTVTVQPRGEDGPTRRRRIECERVGEGSAECRRLAGLTTRRLAPVPPETACAEIYGGPARARVRGELRGETVDVRLNRANSCEIDRWERNRALLSG